MRFRSVRVREDVYEVLARLSEINGTSINELIRQLLTAYLAINEIKEMLRQCLGRLSIGTGLNAVSTEPIKDSIREVNEPLIEFEGNPWVRIIRARVVNGEGREGH
ncbi:ribbon-helix-helix protein, CopG family [Vulcanisaeta distributa]|uniref:Ribbon-helix-helix protein CopG domain-containing protein n=1 Tax=Vulcanisaeta distributa (strain DSM 14429 / JCM 11212 / NBRC 100878 / IC-017) TaxID=572478 RepID=E1QSQ2_VULDI|nr:ribbon-helix-helix protein, CopG family [Vulcanisaeta distributa]ADN49569.1 hypothetical protein Vdis_0156 [Vulcanisaeta distributa DSM 14429]